MTGLFCRPFRRVNEIIFYIVLNTLYVQLLSLGRGHHHLVIIVSPWQSPCAMCHCSATSLSSSSRHTRCVVVIMVWMCYHRHHIAPTSSLLLLHRSHLIVIIVLPWQSPWVLCRHRCAGMDVPSLTSSSSLSHLCRSWPLHHHVGVMVGGWVVALVVATSSTLVVAWSMCCRHCHRYIMAIVLLLLLSCCGGICHVHCIIVVRLGRGGRSHGCHCLVYQ